VSFARGDVVIYNPVIQREGRSNLRLVVSADAINANAGLPTMFALHVVSEDPGGLLAVRIGDHGWAFALELDRPLRSRLTHKVGQASTEELDAVDLALRALFDL
jgi:mRNA-degrading endonuclease toxin of MazEF toxin-antitoxin module